MSKLSKKVGEEIERDVAELEHAADEIRLKLHLASMDSKTTWRELEKQLQLLGERLQREGASIADATYVLIQELKQSLQAFNAKLA